MSSTIELCADMESEEAELHRAAVREARFEELVRENVADGIPEIAARIRTDKRPKAPVAMRKRKEQ